MKQRKTRLPSIILSTIVSMALVFTLMPATGLAASGDDGTYCWNELVDGTLEITGVVNPISGALTIPSTITVSPGVTKPVTQIGNGAFANQDLMTSVTVPAGVTTLNYQAFALNDALTSVSLPEGLTSIGHEAFALCQNLVTINIPGTLTHLDSYVFYNCIKLASDITIPAGVTSIGDWTFYECEALTHVTLNSTLTSIGAQAFFYCRNLQSIAIPGTCVSIGDSAFKGCYAMTATIAQGVQTIGQEAFYTCHALTSVTLPASITSIGTRAFYDCEGLQRVKILSTTATYGTEVFEQALLDRFPSSYHGIDCFDPSTAKDYVTNPVNNHFWHPLHTLTLNSDTAGSPVMPPVYECQYSPIPASAIEPPAWTGHSFAGWYDGATPVMFAYTLSADKTFTAHWLLNSYTVSWRNTYDPAGVPTSILAYGALVPERAAPTTNPDHTFAGWYKDEACTVPWNFASDTMPASDVSLYAKWQDNTNQLANIYCSAGTMTPAFSSARTSYRLTLDEFTPSVTITPVKANDTAVMTIQKIVQPSYTATVANGKTLTVKIKVTFGTRSKVYTVVAKRNKSTNNLLASLTPSTSALSPGFDPNMLNYSLTLPEGTPSVTLAAAAADPLARVSPKTKTYSLKNGQTKTATIRVRSQSGATRTYRVVITRDKSTNADLLWLKTNSSLAPPVPAFSAAVTSYSVTLPAATASVTISAKTFDRLSKVSIDGGRASKRVTLLNGQSLTVNAVVTAQAGNTKAYTVTVNRP
jgi:uncharacterized repeat protein (TIGR02543 family)